MGKDACENWQGICGPVCNDDTNERTQTSGHDHHESICGILMKKSVVMVIV